MTRVIKIYCKEAESLLTESNNYVEERREATRTLGIEGVKLRDSKDGLAILQAVQEKRLIDFATYLYEERDCSVYSIIP